MEGSDERFVAIAIVLDIGAITKRLGFLDIQVWLTGFAYFGDVVSLYSYSLFL